jgi:Protein of unknown function (DUF2842)
MNVRTRKIIGISATIAFLVIYSLVAMAIGGQFIVGRGLVVELIGFVILGAGWLPVVMFLVRWMSRPDA